MKKMIKNAFMVTLLFVASSCSKEKQLEQTKIEIASEVSIETLKAYMSKLVNVEVEKIAYNEKTEQFSLVGIDQISKKELIESYKRSLK